MDHSFRLQTNKNFPISVGRVLGVALILFIVAAPVLAQTAGRISGVVTDPSGAVVAAATVSATNEATSQKATATTGSEGGFVIPGLQAGSYTLEANATRFHPVLYQQAH